VSPKPAAKPRLRPRRGTPADTRARLVAAAAATFNRVGYHGTDSNRIARAAGYAAGTFYKHFADKREILLAAYEAWVTSEWREVERELVGGGAPDAVAERILAQVLRHHVRWRGLRRALAALVAEDAAARRFHREQRLRQLDLLAALRRRAGAPARARERDAVDLFAMERVCDGIANGEVRELRLDRGRVLAELRARIEASISGG
jgi:AcrR family transcriptional regulator